MNKVQFLLIAAMLALPAPAAAQADNFTIVNATGISLSSLAVRRFGTDQWLPLVVDPVPVPDKGRGAAQFKNQDCAFDLRGTLPNGETVVWSGVNLCEVKTLTLNRGANGELWVDYR